MYFTTRQLKKYIGESIFKSGRFEFDEDIQLKDALEMIDRINDHPSVVKNVEVLNCLDKQTGRFRNFEFVRLGSINEGSVSIWTDDRLAVDLIGSDYQFPCGIEKLEEKYEQSEWKKETKRDNMPMTSDLAIEGFLTDLNNH